MTYSCDAIQKMRRCSPNYRKKNHEL